MGKCAKCVEIAPPDGEQSVQIGSCAFSGPHVGVAALVPTEPLKQGGLALLLAATGDEALQDLIRLALPTIPPMARQPFTSLLPDYVVTGPLLRERGAGGFLAAG